MRIHDLNCRLRDFGGGQTSKDALIGLLVALGLAVRNAKLQGAGTAVGAALMAVFNTLLGHGLGGKPGETAKVAALAAGIGALVGCAAGKAHKDTEMLYIAAG